MNTTKESSKEVVRTTDEIEGRNREGRDGTEETGTEKFEGWMGRGTEDEMDREWSGWRVVSDKALEVTKRSI